MISGARGIIEAFRVPATKIRTFAASFGRYVNARYAILTIVSACRRAYFALGSFHPPLLNRDMSVMPSAAPAFLAPATEPGSAVEPRSRSASHPQPDLRTALPTTGMRRLLPFPTVVVRGSPLRHAN